MPQTVSTPAKSNATPVVVAISVIGVLVVAGLIWYFGFYDTAAGRCNRGDFGACLIYYAQSQALASAAAASAAQSGFAADGCTVGPGDGSHDVRLTVSDSASPNVQADTCNQLIQQGWAVAPDVSGATQVCQHVAQDGNTITVTDTGGQIYGGTACQLLDQGQLPSWPLS
jgi:type II secretory pathway pseudopilin PulG